jgi:SAM-dependent methyltransferase
VQAVTLPPKREVQAVTLPPKREMQAVTLPPKREMQAVTTPPRREVQAVTLPPQREMEAVTPPPRREEQAVALPPKREMEAVTPPPKRKEEAVTTPPRREEQAVALPPKREMEAVTPPPKRKEEAVTPPPEPLKSPRSVAGTGGTAAPARGVSPPAAQASATTGALPEAPIRMVESGEVKDGEFEVMEPGDTPSAPLPTVPTPPPVPAISGVLATTSQPPRTEASAEAGGSVGGAKAEDLAREALPLPEALSRRPLKKRLKPWFEEVFDENYLRTLPFMTAQQTLRETAFVKEALSPPAAGEVLDIACGYGRHAIELSQRGFRVTGLDLSLPLLIRAADEAQRRTLSVNFVHADMREMTYDSQFDAAYCVLTSFGYFDEETNLRVATSICRAIKPGGRFLVDTINRDYIVSDLPSRVWWEGDGCVVLEEVDFDFHTSRVLIRRSIVFGDGRQLENEISIRAYSLHELGRVLRRAGFQVLEVSGSLENKEPFLGAASRHVVLVCERPVT